MLLGGLVSRTPEGLFTGGAHAYKTYKQSVVLLQIQVHTDCVYVDFDGYEPYPGFHHI